MSFKDATGPCGCDQIKPKFHRYPVRSLGTFCFCTNSCWRTRSFCSSCTVSNLTPLKAPNYDKFHMWMCLHILDSHSFRLCSSTVHAPNTKKDRQVLLCSFNFQLLLSCIFFSFSDFNLALRLESLVSLGSDSLTLKK